MASRGDIQAGKAFVTVYMEQSLLNKGMKALSGTITKIGTIAMSAAAGIAAGAVGIAGGLTAAVAAFADRGSEIQDAADRIGMATNAVSELGFAAKQSGSNWEELEGGIIKMNKLVGEASNGNKTAVKTLNEMGVSMEQLEGKTPDEQMELFADKIASLQDPARKTAAVMDVFGKSGVKLLPLFADGAEGIKALRDEAKQLGQSMDPKDAQAAAALGDAWDKIKDGLSGALVTIGATAAPMFQKLADIVIDGIKAVNGFIQKWRGLAEVIMSGDLETGGQVAIASLKVAFAAGIGGIADLISGTLGEALGDVGSKILKGDITSAWKTLVQTLDTMWAGFISKLVNSLSGAAKKILNIQAELAKELIRLDPSGELQKQQIISDTLEQQRMNLEAKPLREERRGLVGSSDPAAQQRIAEIDKQIQAIMSGPLSNITAEAVMDIDRQFEQTFNDIINGAEEAAKAAADALGQHVAGGTARVNEELAIARRQLEALRQEANAKLAAQESKMEEAKKTLEAPELAGLTKNGSSVTFSASALQRQGAGGSIAEILKRNDERQARREQAQKDRDEKKLAAEQKVATAVDRLADSLRFA